MMAEASAPPIVSGSSGRAEGVRGPGRARLLQGERAGHSGADGSRSANASPRAALERAEAALESARRGARGGGVDPGARWARPTSDLGEPAKAIHQLDRALTLRRQALGVDNPDTLRSMSRLADAHMAGGHVDRALPLYLEALSHGKAAMGAEDLEVLAFMNNLGRAYLASEPALAEPVLRDALAAWMKKARDDWHTYEAGSLMGGFLLIRKNYAGAEPYLIQGYEGMKSREDRIPARSRRRIDEARARIIALYEAWGKPEKAEEWRKRWEAETSKVPAAR